MPKPRSDVLTEAEQRVMHVLWDKGEASVREVTDALEKTYPVAYNTVLTILRILTDKDYVSPRQDGRAFIYTPSVSRADARSRALKKMVSSSSFSDWSSSELRFSVRIRCCASSVGDPAKKVDIIFLSARERASARLTDGV